MNFIHAGFFLVLKMHIQKKNGQVLEVLVRSNNLTLVEKLISKLISKTYKTPKFTLHILKLKM